MTENNDVLANPQREPADKPPIPQPATDGFPAGEKNLTSRVPGGDDEVKEEQAPK